MVVCLALIRPFAERSRSEAGREPSNASFIYSRLLYLDVRLLLWLDGQKSC
jgi:hypothetical protein